MKQLVSPGFDTSLSVQPHSARHWVSLATVILPEFLSESIQQGQESTVEIGAHLRTVVVHAICSQYPFSVPKLCLDSSVRPLEGIQLICRTT